MKNMWRSFPFSTTVSSTLNSTFKMKKRDLWVIAAIIVVAGLVSSCQLNDRELGADILPPGDNVLVKYDTIFEIDA